jgi:RNA recognition motif-containing protein
MNTFSSNHDSNNNRKSQKIFRNKIFLENLEYSVHENMLKRFFSKFGEVKKCKIIRDSNTTKSKGFGFVEFFNENDAASVFNAPKDDLILSNREIKIDYFREKQNKKKTRNFKPTFSSYSSKTNNTTITNTGADEVNESQNNECDSKLNVVYELPYNVLSLIFSKLTMRDLCMVERGSYIFLIFLQLHNLILIKYSLQKVE